MSNKSKDYMTVLLHVCEHPSQHITERWQPETAAQALYNTFWDHMNDRQQNLVIDILLKDEYR